MADVTKVVAVKNTGTEITSNVGTASQTIVWNRSDKNIVIRVSNTDATTARFKFAASGYGAGGTNLNVDVAQNKTYVVTLESSRFKAPSTQKVTVTIVGTNDAAYGGTIGNTKIEVIELPKGIVD